MLSSIGRNDTVDSSRSRGIEIEGNNISNTEITNENPAIKKGERKEGYYKLCVQLSNQLKRKRAKLVKKLVIRIANSTLL